MFTQEIKVKGKATRVRGATWTHDQVKKLFEVWTQPIVYKGLLNEKKKQGIFKSMAVTLTSLGVHRTWTEIRAKIKNLKADFRKAIERKTTFRYHEQMSKVLNLDGSATPSRLGVPSPTSSGGHSIATEFPDSEDESDAEKLTSHVASTAEVVGDEGSNVSSIPFPAIASTSSQAFQSFERDSLGGHYQSPEYLRTGSPSHSQNIHVQHEHDLHQETQIGEQSFEDYQVSQAHQEILNEANDAASRSSMIITHVVSNVIEPVTTVVMPSSSGGTIIRDATPPPETETIFPQSDQPPIRLEFVVDDENLVLREPSPISEPHSPMVYQPHHLAQGGDADVGNDFHESQPPQSFVPPSLPSTPAVTSSPPPPTSPSQTRHHRPQERHQRSPGILRQQLRQRAPPLQSRKQTFPRRERPGQPKERGPRPRDHGKKRKLLETLNKRTVDTISTLLTETSQTLLQEIQDAEQRFILWEEEKRSAERKREEAMFTKLIEALQSSSSSSSSPSPVPKSGGDTNGKSTSTLVSNFTKVSQQLNQLVSDEVKATEETLRQWELKMQRQDSRHTEKLFAMIINAIKTPLAHDCDVDG